MFYNNEKFYETKYKNYFVSKSGNFLSKTRLGVKFYDNVYIDGDGYKRPILSFFNGGVRYVRRIYLHKLVAETFLGECPKGFVVDHIDHDKLNNSVDNLRYITFEENIRRSHIGVKPKLKMKCIVELNENIIEFESITKAYTFLGLNRHQYNRIKCGAKRVKQYNIISWKEENKTIFVCLTTSSDECTSVENKQRNNDDSLMILETVCE